MFSLIVNLAAHLGITPEQFSKIATDKEAADKYFKELAPHLANRLTDKLMDEVFGKENK